MNTPRKLKGVIAILSLLLASGGAFAYDSAMAVAGSAATTVAIAPSALDESLELPSAAPGEVLRSLPPLKPIDLTLQADDLWQRIRHGFAMPDLVSDLVTDRQAYYLERPEYLIRMVERSRRYLHHIVEELERRGMPTELALLPMVESAFNPMALSSARASGLWQFIPSTGKNYNLSQNWWYDQRRDVVASTNAALDYLQTIYEMHGDWHLALASYNWGEGAVARAIERNRQAGLPTDYKSLSMPTETRYYVPKLQALKNIIAQPHLFGVSLPTIPNQPYFASVTKPAGIDLALAARLADTPLDEFRALNPAFNRPVMPGGGIQSINIPADRVDTFKRNLAGHDEPLSNWTTRRLQRGENLDSLAARLGVTGAKLREVNGIPAGWRVPVGHALLVPASAAARLPMTDADMPASRALASANGERVKVRYSKSGRTTIAKSAHKPRASRSHRAAATRIASRR
ncbi:MAG TPA: transglycosylase SLT domain-containing protein [Rhodocyclaceae bacterium]|nr:transglycosylase SLT domain-containing protein [Rhodocyclaceae bacterium]HMZ83523.1 transglycosylase SLT domain-containing protein [Rhodocyclaceae bacterium]HNA03671.1 transglycosylase SLT domain-containing protein [Rhodocyclaceae bacterium]HNB78933.1 transglycosylase SLT domain-containing protein [Rhodocyclaceae bacterium]HNC61096.1 transglycosylase SLT domain-containing protein [Rhodocyclaceae bacterium]